MQKKERNKDLSTKLDREKESGDVVKKNRREIGIYQLPACDYQLWETNEQFKHLHIELEAIESATNNFSGDNCIGRGGFGSVYKGELIYSWGQSMVAIKRLNRAFGQGDPEFWKETGLLTKESDVYSFGVVLFEVLCGRLCILNDNDKRPPLTRLVRQKRESHPLMSEIVSMLESALDFQVIEKRDQSKRTYGILSNLKFHFMRGGRQQFTLHELLGGSFTVFGRGGLITSFKAEILERLVVFVKWFTSTKIKAKLEFHAHMMLLGSLSHPNLLPYVCYYYDTSHMVLVTDFAINGSLANHLHDEQNPDESRLDWSTRLKIIQGVASGLGYLYHKFPHLSLPHGHLKSSNVLLDDAFNPFLTDYGFLPIIKKEYAQKLMVAYKSPEFSHHEQTTKKTDVWCLGTLILEIMTGWVPDYLEQDKGKKPEDMATWVNSIRREEWSQEVFDENMTWEKNSEIEMIDLLEIGLHCCKPDFERRWNMRKVIEKIQGLKESEED
ncbi:hypothetical protein L1987_02650 [Smallanthus sonchifolius]|uniref:Uncharacterized protein n=1 Tax=Smallanthus sonchifolius TaxID=185202 RepID=A0ACB9K8K8_9ASTR|nr:hypothetical protein L1987_02650 [Smallanthus sonchifolius]